MNKPKKTFTIIDAIHNKDVFGGLPAFSSLATWIGWLAWLKSVFVLPIGTVNGLRRDEGK